MISDSDLLFIEPQQPALSTPIVDDVTRRMTAAFRVSTPSDIVFFGFHECVCGARSSAWNYFLPNGRQTNSLCIHYVAYHRAEVPDAQLQEVASFLWGEVEPTKYELTSRVDIDPIMLLPVDELKMTPETTKALMLENIYCIGDLVQRTEAELLGRQTRLRERRIVDYSDNMPPRLEIAVVVEQLNIPESAVAEIREALQARGLKLRTVRRLWNEEE
jgi:hypothetical protein